MKPCKRCGGARVPRKGKAAQYRCPTCDKSNGQAYRRRQSAKNFPHRKYPYGIGMEVARALGICQQTVSAVMNGACTSQRVTAALQEALARRASA